MTDNIRSRRSQQEINEQMMIVDERPQPVWFDFEAFDMGLTPYQFRVYAQMARKGSQSRRCWQSTENMANECGMSKRQLISARNHLIALGMVVEVPLPDWIEDKRRRCYALTAVNRWKRPSEDSEIGAPPAPIETRCTTCTYSDKLGAPHAPITNHSLDEEKSSEEEKREKHHVTRDIDITNDIAIAEVQTNVSLMTETMSLASDWSEYIEDVGIDSPGVERLERDIEALQKKSGLSIRQLNSMLDFMRHDQFWGARSPQTPAGLLRKSENGRMILHNVLAQMATDKRHVERQLDAALEHVQLNV